MLKAPMLSNRTSVKKADDTKVLKLDKNDWAETMESIVLHLKLVRGARGVPWAYGFWCHIKVVYISP